MTTEPGAAAHRAGHTDGGAEPAGAADRAATRAAVHAAAHAWTEPLEPPPERPVLVFQPNAMSVDAGLFTWDLASGDIMCDAVTYRLHGLPEDASANLDTFLARLPESDLPDIRAALERMTASCGTYQMEYRAVAHDGSLRSMESRARVLPGPDGRPAQIVGLVTDTTAIRAEREAEGRRLREGADRARRAHEFTAALTSAVTVDAIVAAAGEGLRAYGADGVIMVTQQGGRLAVVASCGFDPASVAALSGTGSAVPTPVSVAIQRQSPVYLPSAGTLVRDYPQLAGVARRSPQRSWAALPVPDSQGHVAACLFGFPAPHDFPPAQRALLSAASGLLAQSLERARIYESEHALARELQLGMLPRGSLGARGVTIATRYQAATSGMEIGGDFYDAIEVPGGRVALVIGDVQGHNLLAASLMGQLRTAVHAYAREGHGPAEVMARANQWLADLNTDPDVSLFATCCLVVVRPATRELAMCRAGHPPPVLATPGSPPRLLDCDGGLPLGIDPGARYATVNMRISPGSLLVLTTDGLMETAGEDADGNLRRVLSAVHAGATADLETLADRLLSSPRRLGRHGDDVALLLARLDEVTAAG